MQHMVSSPNFFCVGAVKAGTTALHLFLEQHPQIFMSPVKETNFFSQADMDAAHFNRDYRHDVNFDLHKYVAGSMKRKIHIANVNEWEVYEKLFRDAGNAIAIGEASNSYLLCPSAAAAIHEKFPKARIMMMLRNPIDRVWSQYMMNLKLGKTLSEDFIKEFEEDSSREIQGWGISHNYRQLGMYSNQVRRFIDLFGRDRVLVLFYDDYRQDSAASMKQIYRFLNVDESIEVDLDKRPNEASVPRFKKLNYLLFQSGVVNFIKERVPESWKQYGKKLIFSQKGIPSISAAEKDYLRGVYADDIKALGTLLNRDLSAWLE